MILPISPVLQGSREQLAIAEFAAALLVIPKTLSVNAAKDSTDLVAKLRAYHNAAQTASLGDPKKQLMNYGLDLMKGEVVDNVKMGVLEPTISKVRSLKSALEAATSLLRIDDGTSLFFHDQSAATTLETDLDPLINRVKQPSRSHRSRRERTRTEDTRDMKREKETRSTE